MGMNEQRIYYTEAAERWPTDLSRAVTDPAPVHVPLFPSSPPATLFTPLFAMITFPSDEPFRVFCLMPEKIGREYNCNVGRLVHISKARVCSFSIFD